MMIKKHGSELEFISRIDGDGSGTVPLSEPELKTVQLKTFKLTALSLLSETYIASGFNSYVVKLRPAQSVKSEAYKITTHKLPVPYGSRYEISTNKHRCDYGNYIYKGEGVGHFPVYTPEEVENNPQWFKPID